MPHIKGYLKRKEQKERIWQELCREINSPRETGVQQNSNALENYNALLTRYDFPKRAAAGWAQYKSDVSKQQRLSKDLDYKKWQKTMGLAEQADEERYPQANWSFSQNNQFGYLYGENPEEAYEFAKLVNDENRRLQEGNTGYVQYGFFPTEAAVYEAPVSVDMAMIGGKENKDGFWGWFGDVLNKTAEAESANSAAMQASGNQIGDAIGTIFSDAGALEDSNADMNKAAADTIIDKVVDVANVGGNLAGAQAAAGKATGDTVISTAEDIIQSTVPQPVEPSKPQNEVVEIPLPQIGPIGVEPKKEPVLLTPMEAMLGKPANFEEIAAEGFRQWKGDHQNRVNIQNSDGYRRYVNHFIKSNLAIAPGGSSIPMRTLDPGYTIEEPQPNWTAAENNQFGYLYRTNPKAAADYARNVNIRYAMGNEDIARDWIMKHQGLAVAGAWIADGMAIPEMMASELMYAQYGQLPYPSQVTPSRFSEIVAETIKHDALADDSVGGWVYDALNSSGDAAFQAYLQKILSVGGPVVGVMQGYSDAYNFALYEARLQGMSEEEAREYARKVALSNGAGVVVSGFVNKKIPSENTVVDSVIKETVSNVVGGAARDGLSARARYDALVKFYIKNGCSQEEAGYMAKHQILQEFGEEVFGDIIGGLAYGLGHSDNSIKRSLTRK